MRVNLDKEWRFHLEKENIAFAHTAFKNATAEGYSATDFNDTLWRKTDIPHDWVYELKPQPDYNVSYGHYPANNLRRVYGDPMRPPSEEVCTVGWYRKGFFAPKEWEGCRIWLEFDGVYRDSRVWINGNYQGHNESGYTSFRYDIGADLNYGGENKIAVRVDVNQNEGWWYEGAGIYRHVYLRVEQPVHIEPDSLFIRSDISGEVNVSFRICNDSDLQYQKEIAVTVKAQEDSEQGTKEGQVSQTFVTVAVQPWQKKDVSCKLKLENPRLWDVEDPFLYRLVIREPDAEQSFGIRQIYFDADKGFFLNGRRVQLQGACIHQDFACVGTALTDDMTEYKLRRLKEMGINAYRTAHHNPSPTVLDWCDRLGIMVMDEARMCSASKEGIKQLEAMVLRDRNHPCVILWSIGNEEYAIQNTDRGTRTAQTMMRTVRTLDPDTPITYGGNNQGAYDGINACVDVRGFNYLHMGSRDYVEQYHKDHPHQPMVGSEEASHAYQREGLALDFETGTVGGYDDVTAPWGSTAEGWLKYYHDHPYVGGGFLWTGMDYSGEPYPHDMNTVTSFGAIDLCGYPKDIFYYYRSWWVNETVLYVFPAWEGFSEGEPVRVVVNSNCEEAELFVNGVSMGRRQMEYLSRLEWDVPYTPGELKVIGYRGGEAVKEYVRRTPERTAKIRLIAENAPSGKDGTLLVTAMLCDENDNPVVRDDRELTFEVAGGRILGLGNGDSKSYEANIFLPETEKTPLTGWKKNGRDEYDVTLPPDSSLFLKYGVRTLTRDPGKDPFRDQYRDVVGREEPGNEEPVYTCSFEDCGGKAVLEFARISGDCVVYCNGEEIGRQKSDGYPLGFEAALRPGTNELTVKVSAPEGKAAICGGVWILREKVPVWKRKTYGGLCMIAVEPGSNTRITVKGEGLTEGVLMYEAE